MKKTINLLKDFAKVIDGKFIYREDTHICRVVKGELSLDYCYHYHGYAKIVYFLFTIPYDLIETYFVIKKEGKLDALTADERLTDFDNYSIIYQRNKKTKALLLALFNDLEFKNLIDTKLGEWDLVYQHSVLSMRLNKDRDGLIKKGARLQELKNAYDLLLEVDKALTYHLKRINV